MGNPKSHPTAMCINSLLFPPSPSPLSHAISTNSDVSSEFIHIPSLVHYGIEGKALHLSVETRFPLDEVEIQGTWSHTRPSGTRATLVTFTKEAKITDMTYRNHLIFREPNLSLQIPELNQDDEGDYQLNLNIKFNKTGLVIKEKRTVHVTVDGECCSVLMSSLMSFMDSVLNFPTFLVFSLSPCVHSSHREEPIICSCGGQGKRNLDLFCRERNKSCVPMAKGQHRTRSQ